MRIIWDWGCLKDLILLNRPVTIFEIPDFVRAETNQRYALAGQTPLRMRHGFRNRQAVYS